MSNKNSIEFTLVERIDTNKDPFLIGSTDLPVMVDLRDVTFLVFYPERGSDRATILIRPRNATGKRKRMESDNPHPDDLD